ncbi:hypothetical protein [Gracilibacillus lacisalsi]|uniref:hypothetical protein n=1 Tax=Gracilibacillus lacisalsi TaxID=393087 RepID=UPI00037091B5|nr:hypothetical protein [Gracilibacillus lacisalsi]
MLRVMVEIGDPKELETVSSSIAKDTDAIQLAHIFDGTMRQRDIKLTLEEFNFVRASFGFWNYAGQMNTPMAHSAPAGFGKSTMLTEWSIYHGKEKGALWGGIVAKPKREQVLEFAKEVNSQTGKLTAFPLLGKDENMTEEEYKEQFQLQESAPLLVMTHKMLEVLVSQGRLFEFSKWIDEEGNTRRRTTLLIDERPLFTETVTLTPSSIERLCDLVRSVSVASSDEEKNYYSEIRKMAEKLKIELLKPLSKQSRRVYTVPAVDPLWNIPSELANDWLNHSEALGEESNLLGVFQEAIKRGGTCQVSGSEGNMGTSIMIGRQLWQEITYMNTHVLDGTAIGDLNYSFRPFNKIAPVIPKGAYSQTTVKNCYKHNLGRRFFKDNKKAITKTAKLAKEISKDHNKLLVVVYQKLYDKFEKKLEREIALGKIVLKYFDDERSSNDYADCDAILFLGINRKSLGYYPEIARVVFDKEVVADNSSSGGLSYEDEAVQLYFESDQATDRLQGIARSRNYKSNIPKTIYMFSMNKALPERLVEEYEGAVLEEWELPFSLTDKEAKETSLDCYLAYLRVGDFSNKGVKCSYVYNKVLKVDRRTYSRIKNAPEVIDLMNELGIAYQGNSIMTIQK